MICHLLTNTPQTCGYNCSSQSDTRISTNAYTAS
jgi:hypothetical protein